MAGLSFCLVGCLAGAGCGGTVVAPAITKVVAPAITKVTATQSNSPLKYTLDINGSGFASGCSVSVTGTSVSSMVSCDANSTSTQIEITNFPVQSTTSSLALTVTNPGSVVSNSKSVDLPITVIVSPSSTQATIGSLAPVSLTAAVYGISNPTPVWSVGGSAYGAITQGSTTALYTAPSLGEPPGQTYASVVATVTDPSTNRTAGSNSQQPATVNLLNPVPTLLTAKVSSTVPQLSGTMVSFAVTLTGSNFVYSSGSGESSEVTSGATPLTVSSISSTQITAVVSVPTGTVSIPLTVTNPAPGGGTSTAMLALPSTVIVTPSTASAVIGSNSSQTFQTIVTGTANTSVNWALSGTGTGTTTPVTSSSTVYTPPNTVPSNLFVTLTATSATNATGAATISLQLPPVPSGCSYSPNPIVAVNQTYFMGSSPTCANGASPTGFKITPTPSVNFDGTTGVFSGTPTAIQAATTYTVTPINQGGNGTPFTVQLEVLPRAPSGCTYPPIYWPFDPSQPPRYVSLTCMGGDAPTNFLLDSMSLRLPQALTLRADGSIYGALTAYAKPNTYTIDVSNSGGVTTANIQIGAVTKTDLTPGKTYWGADGHLETVPVYYYQPYGMPYSPGNSYAPGIDQQISDLYAVFSSTPGKPAPNSIFYRAFDDITGCNGAYFNYFNKTSSSTICDPSQVGVKSLLDYLQQTGVIMPIAALIPYPLPTYDGSGNLTETGDAGCTDGSMDITNPPSIHSSELDMYNWGYCTAKRNISYAPENMYWYIGNEWNGQIPNVVTPNLPFPTDESSPAQWRNEKYYCLFRGALAGSIAAIRDLAPYATIISGATGGPSVGLSVALGQDLGNYSSSFTCSSTPINPKGRNLVWDVTNLHWGNDVESISTAVSNLDDGLVALAFPDFAALSSVFVPPGTNMYQALNAVGKSPSGTVPGVFVDEFGSGDGNDTTPALQPLTGLATTALMSNFLANSPATSAAPGVLGGNFYELYPSCSTPPLPGAPADPGHPWCGKGADTTQFLFCYGNVCGDGNSGNISQAGLAVQAWIAQHGNPSINSTPKFTLTPTHTSITVNQAQTASTQVSVGVAPGSSFSGSVTFSCNVFSFPEAGITNTPTCNFNGQTNVSIPVGSSATLLVPTSTSTPTGNYVIFVTASYGGNTSSPTDASTDIHIALQVNP